MEHVFQLQGVDVCYGPYAPMTGDSDLSDELHGVLCNSSQRSESNTKYHFDDERQKKIFTKYWQYS